MKNNCELVHTENNQITNLIIKYTDLYVLFNNILYVPFVLGSRIFFNNIINNNIVPI